MKNTFLISALMYLTVLCYGQEVDQIIVTRSSADPIILVNDEWVSTELNTNYSNIEIHNDKLYLQEGNQNVIDIFDFDMNLERSIIIDANIVPRFVNFNIIDNNRIVLYDNQDDVVYFVTLSGDLLKKINLDPGSSFYQDMDGLVYHNELLIAYNDKDEIIAVNLTDYSTRKFKDFNGLQLQKLTGIVKHNDIFYCGSEQRIIKFTEFGNPEVVVTLSEYNLGSLEVYGNDLYFTSNFFGKIYKLNLLDNSLEEFKTDITSSRIKGFRILNELTLNSKDISSGSIRFYPNPTCDLVFYKDEKQIGNNYQCAIYDQSFKKVSEVDLDNIDMSELPQGIYYILLSNKEGKINFVEKISKVDCH